VQPEAVRQLLRLLAYLVDIPQKLLLLLPPLLLRIVLVCGCKQQPGVVHDA
jgi:hypothetical protein